MNQASRVYFPNRRGPLGPPDRRGSRWIWNRWTRVVVLVGCWTWWAGFASAQAAAEVEPAELEQSDSSAPIRPMVDLGRFELRDLRPLSNVTVKLNFSLYLALVPQTDDQTAERLEKWQHRLRDQVLTATRKTEVKAFSEPDLRRLRRNILLRINRLLQRSLVEEVLVAEFSFTTH